MVIDLCRRLRRAGSTVTRMVSPARGDRHDVAKLDTADLTVSTVANIGPGIDFYFAFGVIAVTAGIGAPLTILAAAVAGGPVGVDGGRVHEGRAIGWELHHVCGNGAWTAGRGGDGDRLRGFNPKYAGGEPWTRSPSIV